MKKKLSILLIFGIFCLSGCTFEYDLTIDSSTVLEDNKVFISNSSKETIDEDIVNIVSKYTGPTNSLGMYDTKTIEENNIIGKSYKREYKILDYNNSVSFSNCYDSHKITQDNKTIEIATSREFTCFQKYEELEEVTVNLTVKDYNVISSNADYVSGNNYIWNITPSNANDKLINIVLENKETSSKRKKIIFNTSIVIFIGSAFAIAGFIALLVHMRGKRKNKI